MNPLYAIVDIETTGGSASRSRITEIAILIHDGTRVIEFWETLVNPLQPIPDSIFALTGINDRMVKGAPVFDTVAQKIFSLLDGRIFVAHNVNFDYSFIKHQLEESGISWSAKKLCTVRMARKIRPGLGSYSLGNLCRSLSIPIENRHRAYGDAHATALLFSQLLEWDDQAHIPAMLKRHATDQRLPPNLAPGDFEKLPSNPGVYYFLDRTKKIIYVGKAVNIKKRVTSHFSGHKISSQRQDFLREIHGISFEVCGTELMALLLEAAEIRQHWPAYNTALKRFEPKFGLYAYQGRNGYNYLAIGRIAKHQQSLQSFSSQFEGIQMLLGLSDKFNIDRRFCKYGNPGEGERYQYNASDLPDALEHNEKVDRALRDYLENRPTFAIVDSGRKNGEMSCIWVEKGAVYGTGYFDSGVDISDLDNLRKSVTAYKSNHYVMSLVASFAGKNPEKVHLPEK